MTTLRLDIDETLLEQAEAVARDMGMDLETAIRVFLKQMVRRNGLPFRPGGHPLYSPTHQAALRAVVARLMAAERTAGRASAEAASEAEDSAATDAMWSGEKSCSICGCLYKGPGRICPACAGSAA